MKDVLHYRKTQNHSNISVRTTKMAIIKRQTETSIGKRGEKSDSSRTASSDVKMKQLLWKITWKLLKMLLIKLPYESAISLLDTLPKGMKAYVHLRKKCLCTNALSSIIRTSQKVKTNLNMYQLMNGKLQWISIKVKSWHMGEPWGKYVKRWKPNTIGQILCDS